MLSITDEQSRVDVTEIFSANQLWFRIISGLFQRSSQPENLWAALIHFWTALKTKIFRTKNQHHSDFELNLSIEVDNKNKNVQFAYGRNIYRNSKFWVVCYCSSNKTDMVQFFKGILPFSRMNFQDYFLKNAFLLQFTEYFRNFF